MQRAWILVAILAVSACGKKSGSEAGSGSAPVTGSGSAVGSGSALGSGSAVGSGSATGSAAGRDAASYTKAAFLADPLCKKVAAKIAECAGTPEFAAALDAGATAAQKKINARLRKAVADWPSPLELCRNAWDMINYEYTGFLDNPAVFKAPDALSSCTAIGAAVKAGGGLVGGKTAE